MSNINTHKIIRICFVCHGNICRSTYAEAYANKIIKKRKWECHFEIDSAGTSTEHLGEDPHIMSQKVGSYSGLNFNHKSRQFQDHEFDYWDYIVAMDKNNVRNLNLLTDNTDSLKKISLLREWDKYATSKSVPDPWGRQETAYEDMAEIISSALDEFFDHLKITHSKLKA